MKKIIFAILLLNISLFGFSQKKTNPKKEPILASISNIKLGLSETEILNKYGNALVDTIHNSTRTLMYEKIKLDNNHEISSVAFTFFKTKLFKFSFFYNDEIHYGLTAKYGFTEIDEYTGIYGNFSNNIKLLKAGNENAEIIYLQDEKTSKLSESEGF